MADCLRRAVQTNDLAVFQAVTKFGGDFDRVSVRAQSFGQEFFVGVGAVEFCGVEVRNAEIEGPVFVDEYDSTTVVPPGCRASLDAFGSINIDVD